LELWQRTACKFNESLMPEKCNKIFIRTFQNLRILADFKSLTLIKTF
jgi:hypothetical protein